MAVGPIKHRGQPIEFGGEKEKKLPLDAHDDSLEHTDLQRWEPELLGQVTQNMLKDGVGVKPANQLFWSDLNGYGKSMYALKYKERYGHPGQSEPKKDFPKVRVRPNPDYSEVTWEHNDWVELVSKKFNSVKEAEVFLKKYGWGHIHTSFMRGAPAETQQKMLDWQVNANMFMFLEALESRGASANGEAFWRFAIKGLSIPTEEQVDHAASILGGRNRAASAFSKHLLINCRGNGKQYGNANRIGYEARGGTEPQKKRVLDSLLNGLVNDQWGTVPTRHGQDGLKLIRLGAEHRTYRTAGGSVMDKQPESLPSDFATKIKEHIARHGENEIGAGDVQRLFNFVKDAQFYPGGRVKPARLAQFDQRAAVPLLNYEDLPWLSDGEKKRAVEARSWFLGELSRLEKQGLRGTEAAVPICNALVSWAKKAQLGEAFGRWLDGAQGRQHFFSA